MTPLMSILSYIGHGIRFDSADLQVVVMYSCKAPPRGRIFAAALSESLENSRHGSISFLHGGPPTVTDGLYRSLVDSPSAGRFPVSREHGKMVVKQPFYSVSVQSLRGSKD